MGPVLQHHLGVINSPGLCYGCSSDACYSCAPAFGSTNCLSSESCLCQQPVGNTSGFVGWRSPFFVTNLQSNVSNVFTFWVILLSSYSLTRPLVKPPGCPQNYSVHWAHLRPSKLGLWLHSCPTPRASA